VTTASAILRWFAPNRFCGLVVPALRAAGYTIVTEGDAPAALAVSMDNQCVVDAYEFARRHRCPALLYVWDLPPWQLGAGRPDLIFEWRGRVRRVSRFVGRHPERPGFFSRMRYVTRRATAVWAPSRLTVDDLARRFGVRGEVVPYCFDSDRFAPIEWRPRTPLRILTVSRLVRSKNQMAVLRAAARMSPRPIVHLIGRGEEEASLRRMAAELGVRLELAFEPQSDEAVRAAYEAATVVVAPSRFEGFGLTAMEAIASGVPAVASDIPPHREHLGSSVTYFRLDDDPSLVAAIQTALERGPANPKAVDDLRVEAAAGRFLERLPALLEARPL
jgi:glycosyltransferase involved in cell wall biosynthesis